MIGIPRCKLSYFWPAIENPQRSSFKKRLALLDFFVEWKDVLFAAWVAASAALAVVYVFIVAKYRSDWCKLPEWTALPGISPSVKITVIIPARNEADKLPTCLAAIAEQSYPASQYEVLVLDDHSEDDTFLLAQNFAKNLLRQFPPVAARKTEQIGMGLKSRFGVAF